jgi:hypothetical protein
MYFSPTASQLVSAGRPQSPVPMEDTGSADDSSQQPRAQQKEENIAAPTFADEPPLGSPVAADAHLGWSRGAPPCSAEELGFREHLGGWRIPAATPTRLLPRHDDVDALPPSAGLTMEAAHLRCWYEDQCARAGGLLAPRDADTLGTPVAADTHLGWPRGAPLCSAEELGFRTHLGDWRSPAAIPTRLLPRHDDVDALPPSAGLTMEAAHLRCWYADKCARSGGFLAPRDDTLVDALHWEVAHKRQKASG